MWRDSCEVTTILFSAFQLKLQETKVQTTNRQNLHPFLNTFIFNVFTSFNLLCSSEVLQAFCSMTMAIWVFLFFSVALFFLMFAEHIWLAFPRMHLHLWGGLCTSLWVPSKPGSLRHRHVTTFLRIHTGFVGFPFIPKGFSFHPVSTNRRIQEGSISLQYSCYYN